MRPQFTSPSAELPGYLSSHVGKPHPTQNSPGLSNCPILRMPIKRVGSAWKPHQYCLEGLAREHPSLVFNFRILGSLKAEPCCMQMTGVPPYLASRSFRGCSSGWDRRPTTSWAYCRQNHEVGWGVEPKLALCYSVLSVSPTLCTLCIFRYSSSRVFCISKSASRSFFILCCSMSLTTPACIA